MTMKQSKNNLPLLFAIGFGLLFLSLLFIRMGVFDRQPKPDMAAIAPAEDFSGRDTWMTIFQNDKKIGFSHSHYARLDQGFRFNETVFMRINTMGMIQDIGLKTKGRLNADFSLKSFDFEIASGRFNFSAIGEISDNALSLQTESAGAKQTYQFDLSDGIYFTSGIVQAAGTSDLKPGDRLALKVFDPIAMGQASIQLHVIGNEAITIMGQPREATKISLDYKGTAQLAWIDEKGDILREEGLLGIILEKTSREEALYGLPIQPSQDLTKAASIPANMDITHPDRLTQLQFAITATHDIAKNLQGGRQHYAEPILTIQKESLEDPLIKTSSLEIGEDIKMFLAPSAFVQSDHPSIQKLASDLTDLSDTHLEKTRKLVAWIQEHIQRRPVISLPDALSTLQNRVGDCNEHAVLFAALARAAGIPTKIEAGVAFLRQRFYYHAWNSVYVGKWLTVDALFNQIPADVTHIRLASGMQEDQLDILNLIGNLKIQILDGIASND